MSFENLELRLDQHLLPDLLLFSQGKGDLTIHHFSLLVTGLDDADTTLEVQFSLDSSSFQELDSLLSLKGLKSKPLFGLFPLLFLFLSQFNFFLLQTILLGMPSEFLFFSFLGIVLLTFGLSLDFLKTSLFFSFKLIKLGLLFGRKLVVSHLLFKLSLSLFRGFFFGEFSLPLLSGLDKIFLSFFLQP